MPRNHATAEGGMKPIRQPTMIWRTPRIKVQRLSLAFKPSMSVAIHHSWLSGPFGASIQDHDQFTRRREPITGMNHCLHLVPIKMGKVQANPNPTAGPDICRKVKSFR